MSEPRFVYPDGVRFRCSRCGDCCRGWNVMLGPREVEALEKLDWTGRVEDLVGANVVAAVQPSNRLALRRRPEDGGCVYLGPESQCLIHEHFGAEAKPLVCRLYPFGFYPVGDRVAVDVSFSCRAVSEHHGAPLDERVPEWVRLLEGSASAPSKHRFSERYAVSGALLWELEHDVLALLTNRDLSLFDRVRAVSEFLRLGTTADPGTEAARKLRGVMVSGIPKQVRERPLEPEDSRMDETQRAVFFHLLYLTLNPTPDDLHQLSGSERKRAVRARVRAADAYRRRGAHPWVDNHELSASFSQVSGVAPGALHAPDGEALAERYLVAKVVGQRFLREGEAELAFLDAVPRLLTLYPMLLWTARALAASGGRSSVVHDDAVRALRLLDRAYGEIRLSELPTEQREAWCFVLNETELAVTAAAELGAASSR